MKTPLTAKDLEWLKALETGAPIAASAPSQRLKAILKPLILSHIVRKSRCGSGHVLLAGNLNAFRGWLQAQFPQGLDVAQDYKTSEKSRLDSLKAFGTTKVDSRAGAADRFPLILDTRDFLSRLCQDWGGLYLNIKKPAPWPDAVKAVGLVENFALFHQARPRDFGLDAWLYYGGQISSGLLEWCSKQRFDFVLLPDYDWVGLDNFRRLTDKLPEQSNLYLPKNLKALIERYGRTDLLSDQGRLAQGLRDSRNGLPDCARAIMDILVETGKGLEQEALLTRQ